MLAEVDDADPDNSGLQARIAELEAEVARLRQSVIEAEHTEGDLRGQLTKAMNEWGAAAMAQAEWDEQLAFAHNEIRRERERAEAIEGSTSWRLLQRALGPYRWIRNR